MKLNLNTVVTATNLYPNLKSKTMPIKLVYKFNKLFTALEKESQFYTEELQKIINEYGERDENGNFIQVENGGIKIQPDRAGEADAKHLELLTLEVEIPDITFTIDELESLELTLEQFNLLSVFIKEE